MLKLSLAAAIALVVTTECQASCVNLNDCIRREYPYLSKTDFSKIANILTTAARRRGKQRTESTPDRKPLPKASGQIEPAKPVDSASPQYTETLHFLLRKNFADISLFTNPSPTSDAEGAQFSWTQDRIANDTSWTADGTVAFAYSITPTYLLSSNFRGLAIAGFASATRELHSNNANENVDVKQFGASGEIGWNDYGLAGSHYFRGTGSLKRDDVKDASIAHGQIEYLPVWLWDWQRTHWGYLNVGAATLTYALRPELLAQYDLTTEPDKTLLFSDQRDAFRFGPQIVLWMRLSAPGTPIETLLSSTFFTIIYHWWADAYSGKRNDWLDAAVVHNLDPAGNIALKFSYSKGRTEDTGANTDLYKISLTAKTCLDVLNSATCQ